MLQKKIRKTIAEISEMEIRKTTENQRSKSQILEISTKITKLSCTNQENRRLKLLKLGIKEVALLPHY